MKKLSDDATRAPLAAHHVNRKRELTQKQTTRTTFWQLGYFYDSSLGGFGRVPFGSGKDTDDYIPTLEKGHRMPHFPLSSTLSSTPSSDHDDEIGSDVFSTVGIAGRNGGGFTLFLVESAADSSKKGGPYSLVSSDVLSVEVLVIVGKTQAGSLGVENSSSGSSSCSFVVERDGLFNKFMAERGAKAVLVRPDDHIEQVFYWDEEGGDGTIEQMLERVDTYRSDQI